GGEDTGGDLSADLHLHAPTKSVGLTAISAPLSLRPLPAARSDPADHTDQPPAQRGKTRPRPFRPFGRQACVKIAMAGSSGDANDEQVPQSTAAAVRRSVP